MVVISQTDDETIVAEGDPDSTPPDPASSDTYEIVLSKQPTANVTIEVNFDDSQLDVAGPGGTQSVVFTPADWNQPKTVTVTAETDPQGSPVPEGTHYSRITHSITSVDQEYAAASVSHVDAQIVDNQAGVLIQQTGGSTDVVEPTTEVVVGRGQVTSVEDENGNIDPLRFRGSFGRAFVNETSGNDSPQSAQDLELADWSLHSHDEIGDILTPETNPTAQDTSTVFPHVTVNATGD